MSEEMMEYFKLSEFDQKGLPGSGSKMNPAFLCKVDKLRGNCGFAFVISSGYRSPEYNMQVSETGGEGPHTTGRAVDILCNAQQCFIIVREAIKLGFNGIGISQKGTKRFVHLDDLTAADGYPRPVIWSY
jgi:zinc D-Ala-D-Ala carboxypeptidase